MATGAVTASAAGGNGASAATTTAGSGLSFRTFLSDINPLQYIPVVGAVYRAVSGDEGNSTLRFVASLGTSFALGGPLGVGITVAEKITGIDPERIARSLLGRLLHHGGATVPAAPTTTTTVPGATATQAATAATNGADAANRPWSAAELSAYAQSSGASLGSSLGSSLGAGGETGAATTTATVGTVSADMLNAMELKRVSALYA